MSDDALKDFFKLRGRGNLCVYGEKGFEAYMESVHTDIRVLRSAAV
jgi:hypothetical protein